MFDINKAAEQFSRHYGVWEDEAKAIVWERYPVSTPVFLYLFMDEVQVKPGGSLEAILKESYYDIYPEEDNV